MQEGSRSGVQLVLYDFDEIRDVASSIRGVEDSKDRSDDGSGKQSLDWRGGEGTHLRTACRYCISCFRLQLYDPMTMDLGSS